MKTFYPREMPRDKPMPQTTTQQDTIFLRTVRSKKNAKKDAAAAAAMPTTTRPQPLAVNIPDAARMLSVSRSKMDKMIRAGDIPVFYIGADRRVKVAALEAYIEEQVKKNGAT